MSEPNTPLEALHALYQMACRDIPASHRLVGEWLDIEPWQVAQVLMRLEDKALVDARTCRLTLGGLVLIRAYRTRFFAVPDEEPLAA